MTELSERDGIYVLHLGTDENRFTLDWVQQMNEHLDQVVNSPSPLVTTADGKFYSNGLDLEWVLAHSDRRSEYVGLVQDLFARLLTLPVPTVAAISGHAFGAGAMLAMAHDWRIMRSDRGFCCFPEIDIKVPFTPGMAALIQAKLSSQAAILAMSTGQRFDANTASTIGLVDGSAGEAELLATAIARLAPLTGKDPATLGAIKATMYGPTVNHLRGTARADSPS